jgi:hypothetical protein
MEFVQPTYNGRVSFEDSPSASGTFSKAMPGFSYSTTSSSSAISDAVKGNLIVTPLNSAFFSPANVEIIQNKIRFEVYTKSGNKHIIDKQSTDDLLIVMRSMYYQYGKNLPDHIKEQVAELNQIVSDWSVPKILAEIEMYHQYRKDISTMPVPLAHPVLLNSAGTRSLPFKPFF